jgi:hypothetical protein
MPRFNVELDGKWACFSGISEEFITKFMPIDEYEKWRDEQYGKDKYPLEQSNKMTLKECLYILSLNHGNEDIVENLREVELMAQPIEDYE